MASLYSQFARHTHGAGLTYISSAQIITDHASDRNWKQLKGTELLLS